MFTNCHTHHSVHEAYEIRQEQLNVNASRYHSVGIHPWDAAGHPEHEVTDVLRKSVNGQTLAIGECGLDLLKGPDVVVQVSVFEQQILLSEELQLPLIIHCVKAWNELSVLRKKYAPEQPWVFHGFVKYGILQPVVASGMMVSLGVGIIRHPRQEEIVKSIPDHLLLLETDDTDTEIKEVYACVAKLKKISLHDLNNQVTANFKNTFTKWQTGWNVQNY